MVITHAKINGPPDLVVEILSPSTAKNDMAVKIEKRPDTKSDAADDDKKSD